MQIHKFSILFLCFVAKALHAQTGDDITFDEEKSYKVAIKGATNGFGFFYRNNKTYQGKISKITDIDFSSVRHPKEKEIINARLGNTRPYVYNKVNRLYTLRLLGGLHYQFADRSTKNSVGIAAFAALGPAITIIKPTYVDVQEIDPNNGSNYIVVAKRYDPERIPSAQILGYSSYFTGVENTKLGFGLSFKTGVEFNWGSYSTEFKSIEIGYILDYMASNPMVIYPIKNNKFFSGFYISFAFGKNK